MARLTAAAALQKLPSTQWRMARDPRTPETNKKKDEAQKFEKQMLIAYPQNEALGKKLSDEYYKKLKEAEQLEPLELEAYNDKRILRKAVTALEKKLQEPKHEKPCIKLRYWITAADMLAKASSRNEYDGPTSEKQLQRIFKKLKRPRPHCGCELKRGLRDAGKMSDDFTQTL